MGIAQIGCCALLMGPEGLGVVTKVSRFSWFFVRAALLVSVDLDALKWYVEACDSGEYLG